MSFSLPTKIENCSRQRYVFGALLTDLSKAFDCLNHEHVIAKQMCMGLLYLLQN